MGGENTLTAFGAARELGYTYIETDVRTTRDGVPLVFHDSDLRRLVGRGEAIGELAEAEVARLRLPGGEPIPTLKQALDTFPDLRFGIDLKDEASVEPVAHLLHDADALGRVCVTSFSERRVTAARRRLGREACTGLGLRGTLCFALRAVLPGKPRASRAAVLQLPQRWHGMPVVTPWLVRRAHRAGLAIHAWTLNDQSDIEQALSAGVDGVITDRLQLLKDILIRRGLWDHAEPG